MTETALFRQVEGSSDSHMPQWLLEIFELEKVMPTVAEGKRKNAQDVFRGFQREERIASRLESMRTGLRSRVRRVLDIVAGYSEVNVRNVQALYTAFGQDFPVAILELILHHGCSKLEKEESVSDSVVNDVTDMVAQFCYAMCSDAKLTGLRSFPEASDELDERFMKFRSTIGQGEVAEPV